MARIERIARCSLALAATLALVGPATADTWVVDDDGGPGVDDTSLAAAIAGASHGDRIELHPGTYSEDIDCAVGITIVGVGSVISIQGRFVAHDVPAGHELRISGVQLKDVLLQDCSGAVVIANSGISGGATRFEAIGCADLRVFASGVSGRLDYAMRLDDSHLEIVSSTVTGLYCSGCISGAGGIQLRNGSSATVADCTVIGADGLSTFAVEGYGGDGATAIDVGLGCELRVTGTSSNIIRGGDGGVGYDWDYNGYGAPGIRNEGTVVLSGATAQGGWEYYDLPVGAQQWPGVFGGVLIEPVPADPVLEAHGAPATGQTYPLVVRGEPGSQAMLLAGREPRFLVWQGSPDPLLVGPVLTIPLGTIPASGTLTYDLALPAQYSPGDRFVLQVLLTGGPEPRLTNSLPLLLN